MATLLVTLDTDTIDHRSRIDRTCTGLDVELAYTTVTVRETEGTSRAAEAEAGIVRESAVVGEWRVGEAVLSGDKGAKTLDRILEVIGAGSFPPPGKREILSEGQRHQLRDAMVLEAHVREGRVVLVSNDARGFVNHGHREKLEALCGTRIMLVDEFCESVATLACVIH